MFRKNVIYKIIIFISILATINAGYLTYTALTFEPGICSIVSTGGNSCLDALTHPATHIFGLPFPAIALIAYPLILLVALFGGLKKKITQTNLILILMSGGGIIFNSYFIYQEYLIQTYCSLCLLCSIMIILILGLSLILKFKK